MPNPRLPASLGRVKALQEIKSMEGKKEMFEGYQEPQKFICKKEKDPIYEVCDQPKEQRCHHILPKQEPFQDYKEHFHLQLQSLENRREELKDQKLAEEQVAQKSLAQLEAEREKMRSTLEHMQKFLEEKKSVWLSKLGEMEKEVEKKEENIRRLSQEISYLSSMITEMEQMFRPPASDILQSPESVQLSQELRIPSLISPEVMNSSVGHTDSEDVAPISLPKMDPAVFFYLLQMQIQAISAVVEWLICQSDGFLQREQQRQRRQTLLILALKHCLRRRTMMVTQSRRKRRSFSNTQRQCERNAALAVHYLTSCHVPRSMWVCPRTERWWENEVLLQWDDQKWEENFRMSKETLFELVEQLRPQLQRQTTQLREPIPVEKRVAIAVWWLSNLESYREVAEHFGVGKSTVGGTVREVCLAIEYLLLQHTIKLGDYREVMDGFRSIGFPQCVGVVGGCHIPVASPTGHGEESMNRKGFFSVLLQGTIDHRGRFINVEAGWSDRTHDAFVFTNSQLYKAMDEGFFVPGNPTVSLGGVNVPPLILADSTYPIRRWLMKPYAGHLNRQKTVFNRVFNNCRNVVGRAFGRLKGRWRRLTASLQVAEENIVCVLSACVVLHNICELKGHDLQDTVDVSSDLQLPPFTGACHPNEDLHVAEGEKIRDAISMSLIQQV